MKKLFQRIHLWWLQRQLRNNYHESIRLGIWEMSVDSTGNGLNVTFIAKQGYDKVKQDKVMIRYLVLLSKLHRALGGSGLMIKPSEKI
jgi:hypothetical protein